MKKFEEILEQIEVHIQHYYDGMLTGSEAKKRIVAELAKSDDDKLRIDDEAAHDG